MLCADIRYIRENRTAACSTLIEQEAQLAGDSGRSGWYGEGAVQFTEILERLPMTLIGGLRRRGERQTKEKGCPSRARAST